MEEDTFEPLDFLRLANTLATPYANEAALRTAIGRAYDAMFLLARQRTRVQGRRSTHTRVREAISPTNQRFASLLGGMSEYRDVADYEPVPINPQFRNWRRNWEHVRRNVDEVLIELRKLADIETDEQP